MKIHFFLALSAILILSGLSTIITGIFFRNENSISSVYLQWLSAVCHRLYCLYFNRNHYYQIYLKKSSKISQPQR